MEMLLDSNGFYKLELFIFISLALLYVVHKKGFKYIVLPIIPLLIMPVYQNHTEQELMTREQSKYITSSLGEVYDLHNVQTNKLEGADDIKVYDSWEVTTLNGTYYVRFNKDSFSGFQIYEVREGSESLIARKNIISLMESLNIDGNVEYKSTNKYIIHHSDDKFHVKMNDNNRVQEIVDSNNYSIYINEEEFQPVDGSVLEKERVD